MSGSLGIGDRVGPYRLRGKLGEGGMGLVFVAEHEVLGKRAAVKVLLPQYSQNQEFVRRFFNEARSVTQIRHPGLIDVYDFGHHPGSGCAYIVMELLDGESLGARLARERRLAEPLIVEIAQQLAGALAAVHARAIVHRDLKPDNVFLTPDASTAMALRVKILDFGVAKLAQADGPAVAKTRTGALIGTPAYMAPEQCRGLSTLDHRADLYSLGCIMYEMAAGAPPFVAEGFGEVLAAHIYEEPRSLATLAPNLSPALAAVITRALAKSPDARQPSMDALGAELASLRSGRGGESAPVSPPHGATVVSRRPEAQRTTLSRLASAIDRKSRYEPRSASGIVAAMLAIVGLTGIVIFGVAGRRRPSPPSTATAHIATTSATPPPQPRVPPPPRAMAKISIESLPSGADVFHADGRRIGTTPLSLELDRGGGTSALVLKASGFVDAPLTIEPLEDRALTVRLARTKHSPSAPRPARPTTPATKKRAEFDAP